MSVTDVMRACDELVAQMREEGTWRPMFGTMPHEVSEALRLAAKLREEAEGELFVRSARSGRSMRLDDAERTKLGELVGGFRHGIGTNEPSGEPGPAERQAA